MEKKQNVTITRGMPLDALAAQLNRSISVDSRMYKEDIAGSIAHAKMLCDTGIIEKGEAQILIDGLLDIRADIESEKLEIDMTAEDIHMFVESVLTQRVGTVGGKLHTARSRNDQVATDLRLYTSNYIKDIIALLKDLILAIVEKARQTQDFVVPGYTHLQRAQPVFFAHILLAYANMLLRDIDRLDQTKKRTMQYCPLGSAALAGTTYPIDRHQTAIELGFGAPCENSIDGVSDRDFCVECAADLSILMMHISRFCEELILWSSFEFKFITLHDKFTTGSSIMPQKKNPDMAELARGKSGRVFGDLMTLLSMLKGLPLAYNKDMQEDTEALFDALDTAHICLCIFTPMIKTMTCHRENMQKAGEEGYINATDLADYLTKKGMPFRQAYDLVGKNIVNDCINAGKTLNQLTINEYKDYSSLFEDDLFEAIDLVKCVEQRTSYGGTSLESVNLQINNIMLKL